MYKTTTKEHHNLNFTVSDIENLKNSLKDSNFRNILTKKMWKEHNFDLEGRRRVSMGTERSRDVEVKGTEDGPEGVLGGGDLEAFADASYSRCVFRSDFGQDDVENQISSFL